MNFYFYIWRESEKGGKMMRNAWMIYDKMFEYAKYSLHWAKLSIHFLLSLSLFYLFHSILLYYFVSLEKLLGKCESLPLSLLCYLSYIKCVWIYRKLNERKRRKDENSINICSIFISISFFYPRWKKGNKWNKCVYVYF